MVSKGQSPPDQLESNYFQLSLVCLKFMLFLAMKIAGVILHLCTGSVRQQEPPQQIKVTTQPSPAIYAVPSSMWVLRGDACAKTYSKELKCVKNNHKCHVCGWGSSCWGGASTPIQQARELEPLLAAQLRPAGCREPGRANHQFIFTHLVLCGWCVISYWVVGLVRTSPHERALSDVWGCCYCFSFQNYGCGILLSPEVHLLKTCFWDTEVQQLFPHFSSCYPDCWKNVGRTQYFLITDPENRTLILRRCITHKHTCRA